MQKFTALEYCRKQGQQLLLLTDSMDLSQTYRSSELGITSNGGLYNYDSYQTLPAFMIGFRCGNEFKVLPQVATTYRSVQPELIKDYVNDFKGGVQLEGVQSSGVFKSDDVLLTVNKQRVLNLMQVYDALAKIDGISAEVEFIRNKKVLKTEVLLQDNISSFKNLNENLIIDYCNAENIESWNIDKCLKKTSQKLVL